MLTDLPVGRAFLAWPSSSFISSSRGSPHTGSKDPRHNSSGKTEAYVHRWQLPFAGLCPKHEVKCCVMLGKHFEHSSKRVLQSPIGREWYLKYVLGLVPVAHIA